MNALTADGLDLFGVLLASYMLGDRRLLFAVELSSPLRRSSWHYFWTSWTEGLFLVSHVLR